MSNTIVAGIDLGDTKSLATVLSPSGDVTDRFSFAMNEEGYMFFASMVPRDARIAFEATGLAYPKSRALKRFGYDVTVAHPKELAWIVKSKRKKDRLVSNALGPLVRELYLKRTGVYGCVAVDRDFSGNGRKIALALAKQLGAQELALLNCHLGKRLRAATSKNRYSMEERYTS